MKALKAIRAGLLTLLILGIIYALFFNERFNLSYLLFGLSFYLIVTGVIEFKSQHISRMIAGTSLILGVALLFVSIFG